MSEARQNVELCGLPLRPWTAAELEDRVFDAMAHGRGGWIVTANIDFLARASRDPQVAALYQRADVIVADGRPLLWAARLAGTPLPGRVAGSDLVWTLARRAAQEGRSLYLLGGAGTAAARAAARFREAAPDLEIAGCSSPLLGSPPTEAELAPLREELAATRPDLVFVALGSPKQEEVIVALRPQLPRAWMLGCGVSLSFVAGDVARAPAWMQRSGVEWLHRLSQEPGRLARRYLLENLPFTIGLLGRTARRRTPR